MAYEARHRFAMIAPTKVRRIADLVRAQPVSSALERLRFVPNRGARLLERVIKSAAANAQEQDAVDLAELWITDIRVDEGPRMKRIRPRARGMAYPILRRLSHISVVLE
jgi:large subunit ribosomal protein L22